MNNTINIGIIGCVSCGKSTLLNGILGKALSDMKIKRTTMIPQIYNLKNDIDSNVQHIINKNKSSNEEFTEKIWDGDSVCTYDIQHPADFINLNPEFKFKIFDIPGINDVQTKDIYMDWLKNNIRNFHFVIYIIDVYSSLNTSDEIDILNTITRYIGDNTHLICLINKCDNQVYQNGEFKLDDEELEDIIKTQIKPTIQKKVEDKNIKYTIQSFSSKKCFLYRSIVCNDNAETIIKNFDSKHLESLMIEEIGKSRWNRMQNDKRLEFTRNKINEIKNDIEDITCVLHDCGYITLVKYIRDVLSNDTDFYINFHEKDFNELFDLFNITSSKFYDLCDYITKCKNIKPFVCDIDKLDSKLLVDFENNFIDMFICTLFVDIEENTTIDQFSYNFILDKHYNAIKLIEKENLVSNRNNEIIDKAVSNISSILKNNEQNDINLIIEILSKNSQLFHHVPELVNVLIDKYDFSKDNSVNVNEYINYIKYLHNEKFISEEKVFEMMYEKMDNILKYMCSGLFNEPIFNNTDFNLGSTQHNNYAGLFILLKQLEMNKNNNHIRPVYHALSDMIDVMKNKYNICLNISEYQKIFEFIDNHDSNIFDDIFNIATSDEKYYDMETENKGFFGWFRKLF